MKSMLPIKLTAGIALIPIILLALQHGALDREVAIMSIGGLLNYLVGVISHTEVPKPTWDKMKEEKTEEKKP